MWVRRTKLRSSERTSTTLNFQTISPKFFFFPFNENQIDFHWEMKVNSLWNSHWANIFLYTEEGVSSGHDIRRKTILEYLGKGWYLIVLTAQATVMLVSLKSWMFISWLEMSCIDSLTYTCYRIMLKYLPRNSWHLRCGQLSQDKALSTLKLCSFFFFPHLFSFSPHEIPETIINSWFYWEIMF